MKTLHLIVLIGLIVGTGVYIGALPDGPLREGTIGGLTVGLLLGILAYRKE